jgi:RsiW-degrading membrane proteinase PrsW (M82 family)
VLILHEFLSIKGWRTQIDWFNHYSGGLAFTYFTWKCVPFLTRWIGTPTPFGRLIYAFLSGCTAALTWDIIEFSSDLFLNTSIQKSLHETMMDLVNGFLGATTTAIILGFLLFRSSKRDCAISSKA